MPNKLEDIQLDEVSVVDKGSNPGAHIVLMKRDISKQATKREEGEDFPAAAYAYVPDAEKPSTWKLRLWDSLETKETAQQVGRALAAIGPGFRGQKVEIPSEDMGAVKNKILAAWRKTHGEDDEVPAILKKSDLVNSLTSLAKMYGEMDTPVDFREAVKEEMARQKMHEMWEKTWPLVDALRESIHAAATKMSGDARNAQIELNVSNFKEKLLTAINQKEQDMNVEELAKRFEELESKVAKFKTEVTELKAENSELKAENEELKAAATDSVEKKDDAVSVELAKSREEIAILSKKLEMSELAKRVEIEYPNIPGSPADKANLLKSMESIEDEAVRTMALGILKSHNDGLGVQMKEIGKDGGSDTTAADNLEKLAKKHAEENSVSIAKAYDAVLATPEGKKLYEQTLSHRV